MSKINRAFSLIEVLIAIAIIALGASLVYPIVQGNKDKAAYAVSISNLKSVGKAMEKHYLEKGVYPVFSKWEEVAADDSPLREYLNDIPQADAFGTQWKILNSSETEYEIQGFSIKGKLAEEYPDYFMVTGPKIKTKRERSS